MGFSSIFASGSNMTGRELQLILHEISDGACQGNDNILQFQIKEVELVCIHDSTHDRMRVIAPVADYGDITDEQKDRMLEANFHSALDARYCVSDGTLFAAFIHPLSPLSRKDVIAGVYQVVSLQSSFGESYSSGLLSFGGAS